ncbi:MAG: TIGR03016 family PEP-CTERM system-associated outer membrane protein [Methylococcaceae bacterium]
MKTQLVILITQKQKEPRSFRFTSLFINAATVFFLCYYNHSYAVSWTMYPSLQTQEIYSDNIRLAPSGNEKSAFVTDVSPGVSIIGQSARSKLNLNYRMQNLYNAHGDNGLDINNQLQFNANSVLVPNRFFLNSTSSISQQNVNNNQIANDNISGSGDSTTVRAFTISPTWTPHFGNYANGNFHVRFNTVTTSNGSSETTTDQSLNNISDSIGLAEIIQLNSGSEFKRVNWNLSFNNNENYRSGGDDVQFQNSNAIVRTFINRYFNVFAQGGYSNNSFQSGTNNKPDNGFYYTFGAQWRPSQHYSIEAGYGNNMHVTVNVSPMQRLSWVTTFRDNSVGLNSGQTWQTALKYRTRRSIWSLTHENDTTTTQQILSELQIFTLIDPFGNPIIDPVTNQPIQRAIYLNTLTDEVIVRKIWNFSVAFNAGRSTIGASAFNEDRTFQTSDDDQKVRGLSANWAVKLDSQTSAYISPRWQQTDREQTATENASKDDRYDVAIGLTRSITSQLNGRIEFRHLNQDSDLNTNSYQENRATANLFMRF